MEILTKLELEGGKEAETPPKEEGDEV